MAYLSLALQVRLREDREPMFSLDPLSSMDDVAAVVGPEAHEAWMQVKRFEPAWLAGTSIGEVMFQADYHLKELSMGECEQPVLGMKSAADLIDGNQNDEEWNAREWFVVREAAVHLTDSNVLVPKVQMGVEAREQVRGPDGLEDAKIQKPGHPLVKYAQEFSDKFDLIAERKSVIYHLRELAKATTLAKFLLDAKVLAEEPWFRLGDKELAPCIMRVPQLWNERCCSMVQVQDGRLVDEAHHKPTFRGVYGGVNMALDQFRVGQPLATSAPAARPPPAGVRAAGVRALRHPGVRLPTSRLGRAPTAPVQAMRLAGLGFEGMPQGVDLNLDAFNLSDAVAAEQESGKLGGWTEAIGPSGKICTELFWSSLEDHSDEEARLLNAVFNPHLSDRRDDGDLFVPPDSSLPYIRKLQKLVAKEEQVKSDRIEHFRSVDFDSNSPGSLFPASWALQIGLAPKEGSRAPALQSRLSPLPEFRAQQKALMPALCALRPAFDKRTEDGLRFRIYTAGNLEIRTLQEHDSPEVVAEAFSTAGQAQPVSSGSLSDYDGVCKAVMYVEYDPDSPPEAQPGIQPPPRHYFVVLETHSGGSVLTEKFASGRVAWEENARDLKCRTSLAKVVRTEEFASGPSIKDMKVHKASCFSEAGASASKRKRYAKGVFRRLLRRAEDVPQGRLTVKGGLGMNAYVGKAGGAQKR